MFRLSWRRTAMFMFMSQNKRIKCFFFILFAFICSYLFVSSSFLFGFYVYLCRAAQSSSLATLVPLGSSYANCALSDTSRGKTPSRNPHWRCDDRGRVSAIATQALERREQTRSTRAPCQERPSRPELRLNIGAQHCRASFTSHFWAPLE